MVTKRCATCGIFKDKETEFPSTGWHTRKDHTRVRLHKPDCKLCHNAKVSTRFFEMMEQIGIVFKCTRCGYDKCRSNIDFHHFDPSQKDFTIGMRRSVKLETLILEINKCIILCKICHGELHAGLWQLDNLGL